MMDIQKKSVNYDIIVGVLNGEDEAIKSLYECYEPLLMKLSKIPVCEDGNVKFVIKQDLYLFLKSRLYEIAKKFDIDRKLIS